ncbi:MAG: hypothetical protein ACT4P1_17955 [Sporichthyaceae bacterium]
MTPPPLRAYMTRSEAAELIGCRPDDLDLLIAAAVLPAPVVVGAPAGPVAGWDTASVFAVAAEAAVRLAAFSAREDD